MSSLSSTPSIRYWAVSRHRRMEENTWSIGQGGFMGLSKTLNIAMIGYGFMGRAHSNAFQQASRYFDLPYNLKLKTVCGRNQSNLDHMARQWGWEETARQWED